MLKIMNEAEGSHSVSTVILYSVSAVTPCKEIMIPWPRSFVVVALAYGMHGVCLDYYCTDFLYRLLWYLFGSCPVTAHFVISVVFSRTLSTAHGLHSSECMSHAY
jgi:hypothetical protein